MPCVVAQIDKAITKQMDGFTNLHSVCAADLAKHMSRDDSLMTLAYSFRAHQLVNNVTRVRYNSQQLRICVDNTLAMLSEQSATPPDAASPPPPTLSSSESDD